jgi:hypothetical protein
MKKTKLFFLAIACYLALPVFVPNQFLCLIPFVAISEERLIALALLNEAKHGFLDAIKNEDDARRYIVAHPECCSIDSSASTEITSSLLGHSIRIHLIYTMIPPPDEKYSNWNYETTIEMEPCGKVKNRFGQMLDPRKT